MKWDDPPSISLGEVWQKKVSQAQVIDGDFHSHGATPNLVEFRDNPIHKWMMTGGTPMTKRKPPERKVEKLESHAIN